MHTQDLQGSEDGSPGLIENLRTAGRRLNVPMYLLILTLSLYFVLDEGLHRTLYHVLVIPLSVALIPFQSLKEIFRSTTFKLAILFLFYLSLSRLWAPEPSVGLFFEDLSKILVTGFFMASVVAFVRHDKRFLTLLFISLGLTGGIAAIGAIAFFLGTQDFPAHRLIGFGQTDHAITGAAIYGVVGLSLWLYLLPMATGAREKTLLVCGIAIIIFYMALTQSRGPMLALVTAVVMIAFLRRQWIALLSVAGPIAAVAAMLLFLDFEPGTLIERGTSYRVELWRQTLSLIGSNFWFGNGLGDVDLETTSGMVINFPHSIYLSNQLYGGIVATVLLAALILLVARAGWRDWREDGNLLVLGVLSFGLLCGLFDFRLIPRGLGAEHLYFWLPVALAAAREIGRHPAAARHQ